MKAAWGTVRTLKQGIVGTEKMRLGERVKRVGVKTEGQAS